MEGQEHSPVGRYRSDLRNVIGSSASAYGYTLTIWSTGMVLSHAYGPPSPPQVILLPRSGGGLRCGRDTDLRRCERGVRRRVEPHPAVGQLPFPLGGIGGGGGLVCLCAHPELTGLALGAFVATASYLVVVGAENTAANVGAGE